MPKRKFDLTQEDQKQPKKAPPAVVTPPKRRCIGEPDVTVVVGGVSFQHYSFLLCYGSEYFDTMLGSGMSESQNNVIEFPDKNPAEWKLVYPFLEPRSLSTAEAVKITKDNAKSIIPWFHEFGMSKLLKEADDRLWSSLLLFKRGCYPSDHRTLAERKNVLNEILQWTETSDRYELPKTRRAMVKELKKALTDFPELITRELLQQLMPLFCTCNELWETAKSMLPNNVSDNTHTMTDDELKSNPLFLDLLHQSYKVAWLEKQKNSVSFSSSRAGRLDRTRAHRLAAGIAIGNNDGNSSDASDDNGWADNGWALRHHRLRNIQNQFLDNDIQQHASARRLAIRRRIAMRHREHMRRAAANGNELNDFVDVQAVVPNPRGEN